jgi:hypothetical protein
MASGYLKVILASAIGWWAWSGPLKDMRDRSQQEQLADNARRMELCLHGEAFAAGAGAEQDGDPEKRCASRHGLYRYQGQWWSYDQTSAVRTRRASG